jgi:hypothetical protein
VRLQDPNTAAADAVVAEVLAGLSPSEHPHLAPLYEELLSGTPTSRLIWSLEVLIDGIAPRSQPARGATK